MAPTGLYEIRLCNDCNTYDLYVIHFCNGWVPPEAETGRASMNSINGGMSVNRGSTLPGIPRSTASTLHLPDQKQYP